MKKLTNDEINNFQTEPLCHICKKPCKENEIRHRDHCHFTGKYRGPANQACNVNF